MSKFVEHEDRKYQFLTCLKCGDEYADEVTESFVRDSKVLTCVCGHRQNANYFEDEDVWVVTQIKEKE